MLKCDIDQGDKILDRCRWRIPHGNDERVDFKQELCLPLARQFGVDAANFSPVNCDGELMLLILELRPLLVQLSGWALW